MKEELSAFSGMLVLMRANPAHHVYIYRSGDFFNVTEISRVMTFKPFQAILNSLYINDRNEENKKREEGDDKLAKVRPLVSALNKQFAEHYRPSTHHSVHKSMIAFRGNICFQTVHARHTHHAHQERVQGGVPCRL